MIKYECDKCKVIIGSPLTSTVTINGAITDKETVTIHLCWQCGLNAYKHLGLEDVK